MTQKFCTAKQHGALLLEALIGILLFSIGILSVVALQATAMKEVTQAKMRSDAGLLANQLIGQIWANRSNAATYAYCSGTAPALLTAWITEVNARLPNSTTYKPCVQVVQTAYAGPPAYTSNVVTVTLSWQMPEEYNRSPRPPAHSLTFSTLIPCC